jgi:hypothetical protein
VFAEHLRKAGSTTTASTVRSIRPRSHSAAKPSDTAGAAIACALFRSRNAFSDVTLQRYTDGKMAEPTAATQYSDPGSVVGDGVSGGEPHAPAHLDGAKAHQLREKGITATDVAKTLGVSHAIVYRYLAHGAAGANLGVSADALTISP